MHHLARVTSTIACALTLAVAGCTTAASPIAASGPYPYAATIRPPFERVAVLVTITNRSADDLQVNPADFIARDSEHRVYPANPTATSADGDLVRLATGRRAEALPLPAIMLRQADVLSGFIVFDVPEGVRPVEVIWRQSDTDQIAYLTAK